MKFIVIVLTTLLFSLFFISNIFAQEEFEINDSASLVNAIGSNRTLILNKGNYIFDKGVNLSNINNLKIQGQGENREEVRILVKERYDDVITMDNVDNIEISNLTIGHEPEGYCLGGVVMCKSSSNIQLNNLTLFGSGIEGLSLSKVENLRLENSMIRDCSYYSMTIVDSHKIKVVNTIVKRSSVYENFIIISSDILFDKITVFSEPGGYPVFNLDDEIIYHLQSKKIVVEGERLSNIILKDSKISGVYNTGELRRKGREGVIPDQIQLLTNRPNQIKLENSEYSFINYESDLEN